MTFQELREHCEGEGCNFTHLGFGVYIVKNCINAECCLIEDLQFYSTATLAHYFFELNIPAPYEYEDYLHIYHTFRNEKIDVETVEAKPEEEE